MNDSSNWPYRILAVLAVLLGLLFTVAGSTKLLALPWQVANFARWGLPEWFMYVTGAVEVAGGLMLMIPRLRAWGVALMLPTMLGAIITHVQAGEAPRAVPAAVFLTILILLAMQLRRTRATSAVGARAA